MKKKISVVVSFVTFLILFSACSSSEETTQASQEESQPEVYVFDDVTENDDTTQVVEDTMPQEQPAQTNVTQYFVQVGAFTTQGRADQFQKENSSKTSYPMEISYSEEVKLYVVQLPPFATKAEAESVRNELWQIPTFKDAFIVIK